MYTDTEQLSLYLAEKQVRTYPKKTFVGQRENMRKNMFRIVTRSTVLCK